MLHIKSLRAKIDTKDISKVEMIINGAEKNLTILDGYNLPITINLHTS